MLKDGWFCPEAAEARARDPTLTGDRMARMVWDMETAMNTKARELWPRGGSRFPIPFSEDAKRRLRWHGILRQQAWMTMISTRTRLYEVNALKPAKDRVQRQHNKGTSLRVGKGELWDQGDTMELILRAWHRYSRWHTQEAIIKGEIRRGTRQWEHSMETDIRTAGRDNDRRRQWHLMRVLGGTGHRSRKRNVRHVKREDPSVQEWMDAMAKAGGDGGCEAEEVARPPVDTPYDRQRVLPVPRDEPAPREHILCFP